MREGRWRETSYGFDFEVLKDISNPNTSVEMWFENSGNAKREIPRCLKHTLYKKTEPVRNRFSVWRLFDDGFLDRVILYGHSWFTINQAGLERLKQIASA